MLLVLDCEEWVYLVNEKTCLVMVEGIKGWIIGFVYRGRTIMVDFECCCSRLIFFMMRETCSFDFLLRKFLFPVV